MQLAEGRWARYLASKVIQTGHAGAARSAVAIWSSINSPAKKTNTRRPANELGPAQQ
jgi:hypothetical protein